MEGNGNSFLFANDGSFMERFKQMQEQAAADATRASSASAPVASSTDSSKSALTLKKASFVSSALKPSSQKQKPASTGGSKLAFSLKQKTRSIVNPLKLCEDDDEDESDGQVSTVDQQTNVKKSISASVPSTLQKQTIPPPPPTDPEVKNAAEKLAHFVAKNGRKFENMTREKRQDDPLFRFLSDVNCSDYKYYSYCLSAKEKELGAAQNGNGPGSALSTSLSQGQSPKRGPHLHANYQTPASALYSGITTQQSHQQGAYAEAPQEPAANIDSVSMMEFYMQKAASEAIHRPQKRSRDEIPPPASLQAPSPPNKRGHHMGDYIPQEELEKFLAKCNDAKAQSVAKEVAERAKIQSDNVGHRLLSKMGWKEGEGLGSGRDGRADPVEAGSVKVNNLGVGAVQPGEVSAEDDIYEQYKKRMMLGYRYRPNPLNNPRKAYY